MVSTSRLIYSRFALALAGRLACCLQPRVPRSWELGPELEKKCKVKSRGGKKPSSTDTALPKEMLPIFNPSLTTNAGAEVFAVAKSNPL